VVKPRYQLRFCPSSKFAPGWSAIRKRRVHVNENLVRFFRSRPEIFPLQSDADVARFLEAAIGDASILPVPAKIVLGDDATLQSYGFPLTRTPVTDDLLSKLDRWLDQEIAKSRAAEGLQAYCDATSKVARNAMHASILADYHSTFWLLHTAQVAYAFTVFPRRAMAKTGMNREQADALKSMLVTKWIDAIRNCSELTKLTFLRFLLDNPLIIGEEFIGSDLHEIRARKWIEERAARIMHLLDTDPVFRRAMAQLGYPTSSTPPFIALLDPRVQQLASDDATHDPLAKRLLEYVVIYHLRRAVIWMKTTSDGDNVSDDGKITYSRALRPMNFGRRGVVEPIVYRFGLVYDITSFTQTLGEIARGGKDEEQTSYRQMLDFQRQLAVITNRNSLQFEKFLGDGAFYTSRRAIRTLQAAIEIQSFYAAARAKGFAFNKGMRIAVNYGYYRLLPMQVTTGGNDIMEFYGPGIVELSRLTSGKATKEIEDIQHLLLSQGYDQDEVYRFFAPLSRAERNDWKAEREFYASVTENGHLMNEGIVSSIPFVQQLAAEIAAENQKLYRLRTSWSTYVGITATDPATYIGLRLLGAVSLKGIGNQEVVEIVRLGADEADVSLIDEANPLVQLLQQERHRSTVRSFGETDVAVGLADLIVCQSNDEKPLLLVGEWDPVSEEVRRPVELEAERYGLQIPLTTESVESQSIAFQKLYHRLSRLDTLPNFSVQAIRDNTNFSGFLIGATVERL